MRLKTNLILLLLIFSCISITYGQTENTDTGILIGNSKTKTFFSKHLLSSLAFDVNYSIPNFYSENFINNIDQGLIKVDFGWAVSLKFELFDAFILDANYSQIKYTSELTVEDILFDDFGIDLSYSLLRTSFFKPYIGAGYRFSKLSLDGNTIDTSQEIWKAGFVLNFLKSGEGYGIYLIGEYKQPFDTSTSYSYNQITLGLGVKIGNY